MSDVINQPVEQFIGNLSLLPNDFHAIATQLRHHFLTTKPELLESIKYGGLIFTADEKLIAGIFAYKNHLSVEFSQGVDLPDPNKLLEGKGKQRRHIKLMQLDDIKNKSAFKFIELTCETVD